MELKQDKETKPKCDILLLIVPYGIETLYKSQIDADFSPFNRTLWN